MDISIVTILLDMFTKKKKILLDKSTNLATNVILKKKLKVALTFRKKKKKKKALPIKDLGFEPSLHKKTNQCLDLIIKSNHYRVVAISDKNGIVAKD